MKVWLETYVVLIEMLGVRVMIFKKIKDFFM